MSFRKPTNLVELQISWTVILFRMDFCGQPDMFEWYVLSWIHQTDPFRRFLEASESTKFILAIRLDLFFKMFIVCRMLYLYAKKAELGQMWRNCKWYIQTVESAIVLSLIRGKEKIWRGLKTSWNIYLDKSWNSQVN